MALVELKVNGRSYQVTCDDGQEQHLQELGAYLDAKVGDLAAGIGRVDEAQLLVMAALLIADELYEARSGKAKDAEAGASAAGTGLEEQGIDPEELTEGLGRCAERLAALAGRLNTT